MKIKIQNKKKKYVPYEHYLRRKKEFDQMEEQGIKLIFKKNRVKIIAGGICLIIAVVPNGLGVVFYPLGFYLLGLSSADFFRYKDKVIRAIKNKVRSFKK